MAVRIKCRGCDKYFLSTMYKVLCKRCKFFEKVSDFFKFNRIKPISEIDFGSSDGDGHYTMKG